MLTVLASDHVAIGGLIVVNTRTTLMSTIIIRAGMPLFEVSVATRMAGVIRIKMRIINTGVGILSIVGDLCVSVVLMVSICGEHGHHSGWACSHWSHLW
jgi:hypothetical protein